MADLDYDRDVTIPRQTSRKGGVLAVADEFEILKSLGSGGFGTVYLARDTTSDIEVALKVVGKDCKAVCCSFGWNDTVANGSPVGSRDIEKELRENFKLIHGLTHPNIAVAYPLHLVREVKKLAEGISISRGDILSVMAYAPGVTLDKWRMMFKGGRVPERVTADIVRQIASALDYAHANGVIHRDVKPSNIMVDTREGCKPVVRLLDFGLAVAAGGGGICGTPRYMSPEQWDGKNQDRRTDQYSLAVLACELLTGHVPFENVFDECGDREVMRIAVMNREPECPQGLSAGQRKVIARALSKSPDKRFATCGELAAALAPSSGRSRFKWMLLVLVAVAVGAVWLTHMRENAAKQPRPVETTGTEAKPAPAPKTVLTPVTEPEPVTELKPAPGTDAQPQPKPTPPHEETAEPVQKPESVTTPPNASEPALLIPDPPAPVQPVTAPPTPPKPVRDAAVEAKAGKIAKSFEELSKRYRDPDGYKGIAEIRQRIAEAQQGGAFKDAGALCDECDNAIREKEDELAKKVGDLLVSAENSLDALDWIGAIRACAAALAIEPANSQALELRLRTNKDAMLKKADEFAGKKSWAECLKTAKAILELDPNNRRAQRLQARAENGISTLGIPRVVTSQNTMGGAEGANGLEPFNQRRANDDWRHR